MHVRDFWQDRDLQQVKQVENSLLLDWMKHAGIEVDENEKCVTPPFRITS